MRARSRPPHHLEHPGNLQLLAAIFILTYTSLSRSVQKPRWTSREAPEGRNCPPSYHDFSAHSGSEQSWYQGSGILLPQGPYTAVNLIPIAVALIPHRRTAQRSSSRQLAKSFALT
ncbi:hypothetical protein BJX61DRAFT_173839 [Aspergillus egyptiacus]|nr:hypothetical protein BJX61DRAFT_173839 [Aspergillus egyptiacus]